MEHRRPQMVIIILSFLIFVVLLFFNSLASGLGKDLGIFLNTTGEISRLYDTEITPVGWTFAIWAVIYTWQLAWFIYGLTTLCRKGIDGYLYYSPTFMPLILYIVFVTNNAMNVGWLLLWDRQYLEAAFVFLFFIAFTLYVCLFISFRALERSRVDLLDYDLGREVTATRFLVQNGIGVYAGWTTIATLLNLAVVVQYRANASRETAGTVSLAILSVEVLAYFTADIVFLDRWTRYFVTPYFVVVWALSGVLTQNWNPARRNPIWTLVLCVVAGCLLVTKIIVTIWRHLHNDIRKIDVTPIVQVEIDTVSSKNGKQILY